MNDETIILIATVFDTTRLLPIGSEKTLAFNFHSRSEAARSTSLFPFDPQIGSVENCSLRFPGPLSCVWYPYVILSIRVSGRDLAGDISIANMNGGNGQCAKVIDAPSPQHAMKISGAKVAGNILSFRGPEKVQFEMSLSGGQTARLKFLNTPGEPWQLVKSADPSQRKQTHNQTTTPASLTEGGLYIL